MKIKYIDKHDHIIAYGWQVNRPKEKLELGVIGFHSHIGMYGFLPIPGLILGSICLASISKKLIKLNKDL